MARFLSPEALSQPKAITLSPQESHHLARVLRLQVGDLIELIDGAGAVAKAEILDNSPKRASVQILSIDRFEKRPKIHLAFSLPKSAALDFIIHRCTEVGISEFQPILSEHSLKANHWNEDRWKKVVEEVAKQCQAPYFPTLSGPLELSAWLSQRKSARPLLYCYENEREPREIFLPAQSEIDLIVGAEGGFSEKEVELLRRSQGSPFGLGSQRLRAETAALTAVILVKKMIGEM